MATANVQLRPCLSPRTQHIQPCSSPHLFLQHGVLVGPPKWEEGQGGRGI